MFSQVHKDSSELTEMKTILQANTFEDDNHILILTNQVQNLTTLVQASHSVQQPQNRCHHRHTYRHYIIFYYNGSKGHISRFCQNKTETTDEVKLNQ